MTRIVVAFFFLVAAVYPASARTSILKKTAKPSHSSGVQAASVPQPARVAAAVHSWRLAHEDAVMKELVAWLSIPNTANDAANIGHNATMLVAMLHQRGFETRVLPIPGRGPVVIGSLKVPGATRTVIFYAHYDGQPVDPARWHGTKPFVPALRTNTIDAGGRLIPFPPPGTPYQDDWRLYARSSGDDKSPIIALLAAIDAMRAEKIPLAVNVKLISEGEEEAGSTHLEQTLMPHRDLLHGDLLISADGPVDQGGKPLVYFGNRGVMGVNITVYGPLHPLHSGHYGNWAPNPAMHLSQLLASMEDKDGHVLIAHFYDGRVPPDPAEIKAIGAAPDNDARLKKDFGLASTDGNGRKLLDLLTEPSLNIDGLQSGWTGAQSKTIIPDSATASLDMRLVKNITPKMQFARLVAHIRKQGYYVIGREPTMAERLRYPLIATVTNDGGYPAAGTPMNLPVSQALVRVVDQSAGEPAVILPILGGSAPMYIFENIGLPVVGVPIVNFDDNQHSPDENLRLGHFWRGMEIYAGIISSLKW
ncbi:MAG: M20/M25/M40 family metallo-hydrolase [Acidobacteriota bacterium]|nr:M20/M25/M40 family metallo-hydrolase [Acidobacteriota bacterium]